MVLLHSLELHFQKWKSVFKNIYTYFYQNAAQPLCALAPEETEKRSEKMLWILWVLTRS